MKSALEKAGLFGLAGAGLGTLLSLIPNDFYVFVLAHSAELFAGIAALYAFYKKYTEWLKKEPSLDGEITITEPVEESKKKSKKVVSEIVSDSTTSQTTGGDATV